MLVRLRGSLAVFNTGGLKTVPPMAPGTDRGRECEPDLDSLLRVLNFRIARCPCGGAAPSGDGVDVEIVRGRYGEFKVLVDGEVAIDGGALVVLGVTPSGRKVVDAVWARVPG